MAGLGGEARLALVGIGDGERAGGGEVASHHVDVLGDRAGGDAADQRHVVGAVDGHADQLAGGAVAGQGGEAVGEGLAQVELLDRALAVVGGVAPGAVGGQAEGAVGRGVAGLDGEARLALVGIGDGERAGGGERYLWLRGLNEILKPSCQKRLTFSTLGEADDNVLAEGAAV